jgi:hypothetical protein
LSGYEVRLSEELRGEIAHQPHHVRDEFWAVHDQLESLGAPRSTWYGQLELPLPTPPPDAPLTRPFGVDGWMVFRVVDADHEVEILDVQWPTRLDPDEPVGPG